MASEHHQNLSIPTHRTALFLDDLRYPSGLPRQGDGWIIQRSSNAAIQWCRAHGCPVYVSFDHDLGGIDTGMRFAHFLIQSDLEQPGFIPANFTFDVHSANPIGAVNIRGLLEGYLRFRQSSAPKTPKL